MTNLLTRSITVLYISSVNGIASSFLLSCTAATQAMARLRRVSSRHNGATRSRADAILTKTDVTSQRDKTDRHGPQPPPACWAKTRNKADRLSDGGLEPFFTPPRQSKTGSSPVSESCQPWVNRDKNTYPGDRTTTDLPIEDITCTNGARRRPLTTGIKLN